MNKILFLIFIFLFSANTFADEIKGKLTLKGPKIQTLRPGDIFSGVLRLWPKASSYYNEVNSLKGKVFLENFYVSDIERIQLSPNNSEVLEAYLKIILIKNFPENSTINWKVNNIEIPFLIQGILTQPSNIQPKKYIIMDQDGDLLPKSILVLFLLGGLGILLLYVIFRIFLFFINKRKMKEEKRLRKESWVQTINTSKNLNDYIELYQKREKWVNELSISESKVNMFVETMNKYQYQKDISEFQLEEIDRIITDIREEI